MTLSSAWQQPRDLLEFNRICVNTAYDPILLSMLRMAQEHEIFAKVRHRWRLEPHVYKDELLQMVIDSLGEGIIETLGREIAYLDSHPLVFALGSSKTLEEMLQRWLRAERYLHPQTYVEATVGDRVLEVERGRKDGVPLNVLTERLFLFVVMGFLEVYGLEGLKYEEPEEGALRRVWKIRWSGRGPTRPRRHEGPWGIGGDKVREAFSTLLDNPGLTLAQTARSVGVSGRTFQRRLEYAGTNFQEITRVARVTLASRLLIQEEDSITNVALRTGFSDGAHLSREFRSLLGVAPNEFRVALR